MNSLKKLCPLFLLLLIPLLCQVWSLHSHPAASYCRCPDQVLILDAGHGGEDGGAVALSGTPESGINLAIVQKAVALCGLYGVPVRLTRSDDGSLADPDADTLRMKKRTDLLNRVELVNGVPGGVLLSVHQNNYPDSRRSKGAQVFYRDDEDSRLWAEALQVLLRQSLDPENDRPAEQIPDSIYLMNHINCTAVLVECGFLSNPEEDALLETDSYQTRLAAVLTASYLQRNDRKEGPI